MTSPAPTRAEFLASIEKLPYHKRFRLAGELGATKEDGSVKALITSLRNVYEPLSHKHPAEEVQDEDPESYADMFPSQVRNTSQHYDELQLSLVLAGTFLSNSRCREGV